MICHPSIFDSDLHVKTDYEQQLMHHCTKERSFYYLEDVRTEDGDKLQVFVSEGTHPLKCVRATVRAIKSKGFTHIVYCPSPVIDVASFHRILREILKLSLFFKRVDVAMGDPHLTVRDRWYVKKYYNLYNVNIAS